MRSIPLVIAAMAGIAIGVAPVHAAKQAPTLVERFQVCYDYMDAAVSRRDVTGTFAYYSKDYQTVNEKGRTETLSLKQHQATRVLAAAQSIREQTRVIKAVLNGNTATVSLTLYIVCTITDPRTGQPAKIVTTDHDVQVWMSSNGSWLIAHGQTLSEADTINGKTVIEP